MANFFGLLVFLVFAVTPCTPLFARAQALNVDLERFVPALDAEGFLGVQGTRTPGDGRATVSLVLDYASALLRVNAPSGPRVDAVSDRLGGVLGAQLGIGPRAAFGVLLPLVLDQVGDRRAMNAHLPAFSVGDPAFSVRYRLLGDVATGLLRNDDGPGLALQVGGTMPAGYTDSYSGEGAPRAEGRLLADLHVFSAGIGASLGVRHRFAARSAFDLHLRDEMIYGVALKVPIFPIYPTEALLELRGATDFRAATTHALELDLGIRYPFGHGFMIQVGAGPGLTRGIGTPAFRAFVALYYAPTDPDSDGDGIPDDVDACPPLPEDRDGFQDDDGCPDPDNDNDLVPDADDLCPNQAALEGHDENEDGCTD